MKLVLLILAALLLKCQKLGAWSFSSSSSSAMSSSSVFVLNEITRANQMSSFSYWAYERVIEYRCFQERVGWRLYLIPHVGVHIRTHLNREPRPDVNYGQLAATWNWQSPSHHSLALGDVIKNAPKGYSLLSNNCYDALKSVLGMLRPEYSCDHVRCKACGWV
uniref:Uncharacterized protein n=1 Tax=Globodera rostochiensis TaxID=31243 RepID=A0A914HA52_GLORO